MQGVAVLESEAGEQTIVPDARMLRLSQTDRREYLVHSEEDWAEGDRVLVDYEGSFI